MSEIEWRPVPGWEGHYEVSNHGQVRSLERTATNGRVIAPRLLQPTRNQDGYLVVGFRREGNQIRQAMTVHKAVMLAFVGPRPEGQEVRHLDGNPGHNKLSNLRYGTRSENNLDAVRHGTNLNAAKTHCHRGHELTEDNIYLFRTSRCCRRCRSINRQRYKDKKAAV